MVSSYQPPSRLCRTLFDQYDPHLLDVFKAEMAYGVERFFLLSYCLACCWPSFSAKSNLRVVRQWTEMEFLFPSEAAKADALSKNFYVPGDSIPIDVDVDYREGMNSRIFVTLPRFDKGRPATLATVQDDGRLAPYPDYSWNDNQGSNCDGLTSVFRTAIDKCNRIWVMDTGKIGERQLCPPQLLAFDLKTDQVVYKHKFNESNYIGTSLFVTPVLDISDFDTDCSEGYVYVADVSGFGLYVLDIPRNIGWRITDKTMYPYPSAGTFTIAGESFDLMDGILGMALSPFRPGQDRLLYFHALASRTENVVRSSVLKNDSFIHNSNSNPSTFKVFPGRRPNQAAAEAIDHNGVMYFGLMDPPSINCWNTATEFEPRNFHKLAVDEETLQFASGVKIINNLRGEQELWVLTSSFQRVMTGSINSNHVNFRIHAEKTQTLLKDSPCRNTPKGNQHNHYANLILQDQSKHTWRYGSVSFL